MTLCPVNITLNNGALMPALGLGTFQATKEEDLINALDKALETGYRHIDTAAAYGNEAIIGKVLRKWIDSGKIRREELFIVTKGVKYCKGIIQYKTLLTTQTERKIKIWIASEFDHLFFAEKNYVVAGAPLELRGCHSKLPQSGNHQSSVEKYLTKSLADLQLNYVDLYLVHNPVGFPDTGNPFPMGPDGKVLLDKDTDIIATWKGMEAQVDAGRAKAIGLSNFNEKQIQRILDAARIKPANLQVEIHVYFQQHPLVEFCHKNNISVVAYAPLGSKGMNDLLKKFGATYSLPDLMENETIISIAKKHKKSPAHVLLRHILQRGIAAIPKSSNPERVVTNFQVFDFKLDQADMQALDKLDQGTKGRGFDFVAFGFEGHPEYPF